jgi:hypothetical protein
MPLSGSITPVTAIPILMPTLESITTVASSAAAGAGALWGILRMWAKYNPSAAGAAVKAKAQTAKIIDLEKRVSDLEKHIQKLEDNREILVRAGRKARIAFLENKSERGMAFLEMFEEIESSGEHKAVR